MRLITPEDFKDSYIKIAQRGYKFLAGKFTFSAIQRTRSSFNDAAIESANWWIVPMVRERWNFLKTGNSAMGYEEYVTNRFSELPAYPPPTIDIEKEADHILSTDTTVVANASPLSGSQQPVARMISIGSGVCSHELQFARLNPHWEITCIDFSEKLLQEAEKTATHEGMTNLRFLPVDVYTHPFPENHYHFVLFNASLHHFSQMNSFIEKIHRLLVPGGHLIIDEYVGSNRLQYSRHQLKAINECLQLIDKDCRRIFKSSFYKKHYYGSGILRMIIADPSECVESEHILPAIHRHFKTLEEKGYGGNLLMPVLKDISHHFVQPDEGQQKILNRLFAYEDAYLKNNPSDFVFGIYKKEE